MNLLLYVPAILYLFYTSLGPIQSILQLSSMAAVQIVLGLPFFEDKVSALTYFQTSFNFSREFLWKWTVNWRWVGIKAFESSEFSKGLLVSHALVLILVGIKWASLEGGVVNILRNGLKNPSRAAIRGSPSSECELDLLNQIVSILANVIIWCSF